MTAIQPFTVFTTPSTVSWSMIKQRLPVLHEVVLVPMRTMTGLTNGSRRPLLLSCAWASALGAAGFAAAGLDAVVVAAFAAGLVAAVLAAGFAVVAAAFVFAAGFCEAGAAGL